MLTVYYTIKIVKYKVNSGKNLLYTASFTAEYAEK
jgi:hypothetical protein